MPANLGNLFKLLLQVTPGILQGVENAYVHNPQSVEKYNTAVTLVSAVALGLLPLAGLSADQSPSADAIGGHIETVLAQMKASSQLVQAPTPPTS